MPKIMQGKIVSKKTAKSAVIVVETQNRHPIYHKLAWRSKKYLVEDKLDTKIGDLVTVTETRPLSRRKRFEITEIVTDK